MTAENSTGFPFVFPAISSFNFSTKTNHNQQVGTAIAKFRPIQETDVIMVGSTQVYIETKHQCITSMREYAGKSLEELRCEDYSAKRGRPQLFEPQRTGIFQLRNSSLGVHRNIHVDKAENFNHKIKELWTSGRLSDLTIVAKNKRFKVHKTILGMSSSAFSKIIEEHNEAAEIKIDDLSPQAIQTLLHFIYTSEIDTNGNAEENLSVAAKFEVAEMKSFFESILCDQVNVGNAFDMFTLAHRNSAEQLKKKAFATLAMGFPKGLSENLMGNPEKLQKLIDARRAYEKLLDESS